MIYKLNTSIIKKSVDILYNNELENITIHFCKNKDITKTIYDN